MFSMRGFVEFRVYRARESTNCGFLVRVVWGRVSAVLIGRGLKGLCEAYMVFY